MGIMDWLRSWRQPLPADAWEDESATERVSITTSPEGWETHPCDLPLDIGITAVRQVWQCPECGRRWRLDQARYDHYHNVFQGVWTEMMSAAPITDTELLQLLTTEDDPDATT